MTKLRKIMDSILKTVSVFLFAFMTVTGTYQVLSRYLFGKPSTISEGLLSYSFAWMALLAAAYVFGKKEHMRMSFVTDKFSDDNQLKISLIGELITFVFAVGALIYGGIAIVQLGMGQQSPSLGIQMGWIYMIIPVTGIITAIYNVMNIADLTQKIKTAGKQGKRRVNMAFTALFIILAVLVVLLLAGVPISIALGISSVIAILPTVDFDITMITAAQRIFSGMSNFTLIAIPFFILAGNIMNQGGIAEKLVNLALRMLGKVPGSLLHTNIMGNAMFGAISGSATAAAAAIGGVMNEQERKAGYDIHLGAAANIASAPTGLLIPPSNTLITYSLVSGGTSVAALFLAGYIPGILWALGCSLVALFIAKKQGYKGNAEKFSFKALGKAFIEALPALSLIIIVIGGIIGGVFTATEGSVVAVVYSLILSMFFYRKINAKQLYNIFVESAEMSGIIVFLIGVSNIMSWVMAFTGIPQAVSDALLGFTDNPYVILLIMNIILLIVGTFMDVTPAILIFTPIFLPIVQTFGMHPIHFGIIIVFNLCIGNITPPVGNTLFVGVRVAKVTIEKVMPHLIKFYAAILIVLLLVMYIPALSMFLPELFGLVK